jgi:hypothetical protein
VRDWLAENGFKDDYAVYRHAGAAALAGAGAAGGAGAAAAPAAGGAPAADGKRD